MLELFTSPSKLTIKLYLHDPNSEQYVWNDTFIGRGKFETGSGSNEVVIKMLRLALDDLLKQVAESKTLKEYIYSANLAIQRAARA